jgi:hypothetical protein
MTLPGFTAEAALYSDAGLYRASSSGRAGPHVGYTAQLLTTLEQERAVRCFYPCDLICNRTYCYYPCRQICFWGPWGYYGG